ncbi:MAG: hypothetical protein WDN69_32220 [Aliidongia sp.]
MVEPLRSAPTEAAPVPPQSRVMPIEVRNSPGASVIAWYFRVVLKSCQP